MKKTLYSMMLDDNVINEIDLLAHSYGTNRSGMVNQILAEYVNLTTPERKVNDIFNIIAELLSPKCGLVPFIPPNAMTMSLKSSLQYKYRPTIKYEVELYRSGDDSIGELLVKFRTQSAMLIGDMTEFFRAWKEVEERCQGRPVRCALYELRFVRELSAPKRKCTADELANAISGYIQMLDGMMKKYLAGGLTISDIEQRYIEWLNSTDVRI